MKPGVVSWFWVWVRIFYLRIGCLGRVGMDYLGWDGMDQYADWECDRMRLGITRLY